MQPNHIAIKIQIATVLIISASAPAYGYIDPGTGSLIIQGVIGAIAAIGVTLKIYWHKVRVFFSASSTKVDASNPPNQTDDSAD